MNDQIENNIAKVQRGSKKNGTSNKKIDSDVSADEEPVTQVSKSCTKLQGDRPDDDNGSKEMIADISENHRKEKSSAKKGKRGRKNRDDSDDDLDAVLAELALEYSGGKVEQDPNEVKEEQSEESKKSTSTKVKKQTSVEGDVKVTDKNMDKIVDAESGQELKTVKTAAQKKKEKKEREKQKKMATKAVVSKKTDDAEIPLNKDIKTYDIVEENAEAAEDGKKKKKRGKPDEKDLKEMKKGNYEVVLCFEIFQTLYQNIDCLYSRILWIHFDLKNVIRSWQENHSCHAGSFEENQRGRREATERGGGEDTKGRGC